MPQENPFTETSLNVLDLYADAWRILEGTQWRHSLGATKKLVAERFDPANHGDLPKWCAALAALPTVAPATLDLNQGAPVIGLAEQLAPAQRAEFSETLMKLHPWRKGPLNLFGEYINTEWRSDWKWERVQPFLSSLSGRRILDVGCGNGYYALRMLGGGARFVLGIDPTLLSVMQFCALKRMIPQAPFSVLPLGIEDLPKGLNSFDSVFSMGVFYHRKSPFDHLAELREALVPGGELVLETLVIEGREGEVLVPRDRYAQMRNVWFLPSCLTLERWLERAGFRDVRCVDVTTTSTQEQRTTEWMTFKSLADFLDPSDPTKTVEGYPAPKRAVFVANA